MTYTAELRAQIREPGQAESGTLKIHEMIDPATAVCGEKPQVWKGIRLSWSPLLGRGEVNCGNCARRSRLTR